ncbi:MAG: hypothetical protein D6727_09330 [Gammaproteobacteria bacterium]|nr:MAG: hypothetical protein D6727_09330 [Gammaproteobacteria bacterium]
MLPTATVRLPACCRSLAIALLLPAAALAEFYPLPPGDDVIGEAAEITAVYEDTLVDIGRRHGLGYEELLLANPGVDPWLPGEGTVIRLPSQFVLPVARREGLVVNVAEFRLYYFPPGDGPQRVASFPISIGRQDWSTPVGRARIVSKVRNPAWYPPASVREEYAAEGRRLPRVVPPGPKNPLGAYALRLSLPGYLIHGTNRPAGVGMRVTHGCIRMFPEDIDWLFPRIPLDTPVQIVNQPYKLGWRGEQLLLEVHPPLPEDSERAAQGLTAITSLYVAATRERPAEVDWALIERVYAEHRGLPVAIGRAAGEQPATVAEAGSN